jgi:hypothetical protein
MVTNSSSVLNTSTVLETTLKSIGKSLIKLFDFGQYIKRLDGINASQKYLAKVIAIIQIRLFFYKILWTVQMNSDDGDDIGEEIDSKADSNKDSEDYDDEEYEHDESDVEDNDNEDGEEDIEDEEDGEDTENEDANANTSNIKIVTPSKDVERKRKHGGMSQVL